jgi:selenocysteine-specific elongation factor
MIEPKSSTPNPEGLLVDRGTFSQLQDQILSLLSEYHDRFPLRAGMPMQELRSRLKGDTRVMQAVLERLLSEEVILLQVERFSLPDFEPLPSPEQQLAINDLLGQFRSNPYNTPSVKQVKESIGEEPLSFLLLTKQLIQLGPDVLLTTDDYSTMESEVRNRLRQQGTMTIADVRDLFNTSRKYALALMEQLDARGVTIREGDTRRLLN